ncbi:MAG: mechanosensitive ion channel [Bacteroidales bacterium]|nr:mechanosensitive ion channel [Bacteroidales bacterium]MCF8336549.1 mechanosensitive ion channel [Bacteroidales bacterium]
MISIIDKIKNVLQYEIFNSDNITLNISDLIFVVIIFFLTRLVIAIIRKIFFRPAERKKLSHSQAYTLFKVLKYFLVVAAVFIALQSIGINLTFFVAGSAALFVGIGLGVQDVFKDIIAGFILLFGKAVKVGDVIEVEGIVGRVTDIDFRVSKIVTRDDIDMLIPNTKLTNDKVINWSFNNEMTRFKVEVGVAYGSDVKLVRNILMKVAQEHQEIAKTKPPFVRFVDFGNSSLDFELFFWSENTFRIENILSDLRFKIDEEFRQNNVTIPFPQRDIHIRTR